MMRLRRHARTVPTLRSRRGGGGCRSCITANYGVATSSSAPKKNVHWRARSPFPPRGARAARIRGTYQLGVRPRIRGLPWACIEALPPSPRMFVKHVTSSFRGCSRLQESPRRVSRPRPGSVVRIDDDRSRALANPAAFDSRQLFSSADDHTTHRRPSDVKGSRARRRTELPSGAVRVGGKTIGPQRQVSSGPRGFVRRWTRYAACATRSSPNREEQEQRSCYQRRRREHDTLCQAAPGRGGSPATSRFR